MGIRLSAAALAAVVSALSLSLTAAGSILPSQVVNVDFNTSDFGSTTYTGLAAGPATAGTTWNSAVLGPKVANSGAGTHNFGPTAGGLLVDSANNATSLAASITVEFDDTRQYMTDENPLTDANGGKLLNDFGYVPYDRTAGTLKIGGVPGGTYDLYLYSENGNYQSQVSNFLLGGDPQTANNGNASTGVFTPGRNYVLYSGLLAAGDNSTFTVTTDGVINGFQLVQTAVPEPSTAALLAGAVWFVFRRQTERVS